MKKVSIIIPAYNVENYIQECLDSIENQTYNNIEVVVVDDGSSDKTIEIAKEKAKSSCKDYKIFTQPNSGQSVARNRGLKEAKGEYIVFVDSDDWLSSRDAIKSMVEKIESDKADFVQCSLEFVKGSKHYPYEVHEKEPVYNEEILLDMIRVKDLYTSPWAKIYSAKFIKKNGLQFIEGLVNEDTAFSLIIASKASKVSFLNDIVYSSREREGSTSRSSFKKMFMTMHEVLKRTRKELEEAGKFTEDIKNLFCARYLRSMLYNLLQTAQRSNYKTFSDDAKYCFTSTDYLLMLEFKKYLPVKHCILVNLSVNKSLFFLIAKIIKRIGYKMH